MAELGIITMLAEIPKKATFTLDQVLAIYEHSGRQTTTEALQAAARQLYPDILENGEPPILCSPGFGRMFCIDGEYVRPAHTIQTNQALMVGILPDGQAMVY